MALAGKKILITCGPTWVAIDSVRVISNRSSGETGHVLARTLASAKAKVTMLEGPVTHRVNLKEIKVLKYCFFDELAVLLKKELKNNYDCVIHAAAVSDFKPRKSFSKKIKSNACLTLELVSTPKLINTIKAQNPKVFLIGFKLESHLNGPSALRETKKLFSQAQCDLVVANFMKSTGYEALVLDADKSLLGKVKSKMLLARLLVDLLKEKL